MKSKHVSSVYSIAVTLVALVFVASIVSAFTPPTQAPPEGNTAGPVTPGSTQTITGLKTFNVAGLFPFAIDASNANTVANLDSDKVDAYDAADLLAGAGDPVRYWEIRATEATYTGNMGGRKGANDKCQAEFGSDTIFFNSDIYLNSRVGGPAIMYNHEYAGGSRVWFDNRGDLLSGDWEDLLVNCQGWRRGSYYSDDEAGTMLSGWGQSISSWRCDSPLPLTCAIPY